MSQKRILLIHDDRILTNLFIETLQAQGHAAQATRTLHQAIKICNDPAQRPDVILMDLVLQEGNILTFIEGLLGSEANASLPVLILPNTVEQLAKAALRAGATAVIEGGQSVPSIINAVNKVLGIPALDDGTAALMKPTTAWMDAVLGTGQEALNQMRDCLPGLVAASVDTNFLHTLWALVHNFTTRMSFTYFASVGEVGRVFELLVMELNDSPEQVNTGTVRSIGQALDVLTLLLSQRSTLTQPLKLAGEADILIVDDEEGARQIISASLGMAQLRCESVANPTEALQKLENKAVNLIILDVGLPEMTGFDLCSRIRGMDIHKKTPVLFLTGMNSFQNKAKASLSGGNDFIGKPFNLPELGLKSIVWFYRGQLGRI